MNYVVYKKQSNEQVAPKKFTKLWGDMGVKSDAVVGVETPNSFRVKWATWSCNESEIPKEGGTLVVLTWKQTLVLGW